MDLQALAFNVQLKQAIQQPTALDVSKAGHRWNMSQETPQTHQSSQILDSATVFNSEKMPDWGSLKLVDGWAFPTELAS